MGDVRKCDVCNCLIESGAHGVINAFTRYFDKCYYLDEPRRYADICDKCGDEGVVVRFVKKARKTFIFIEKI